MKRWCPEMKKAHLGAYSSTENDLQRHFVKGLAAHLWMTYNYWVYPLQIVSFQYVTQCGFVGCEFTQDPFKGTVLISFIPIGGIMETQVWLEEPLQVLRTMQMIRILRGASGERYTYCFCSLSHCQLFFYPQQSIPFNPTATQPFWLSV